MQVRFGNALYFPLTTPALVRQALSRDCSVALQQAAQTTGSLDAWVSLGPNEKAIFRRKFDQAGKQDINKTKLADVALEVEFPSALSETSVKKVFDMLLPVLKKNTDPQDTLNWPSSFDKITRKPSAALARHNQVTYTA